jgi:hypothetical protein
MMAMDMKFSRVPGDIACYQHQPQREHRHDTHNSDNNNKPTVATNTPRHTKTNCPNHNMSMFRTPDNGKKKKAWQRTDPNSMDCGKDKYLIANETERVHLWTPGDFGRCFACKECTLNPYQHVNDQCEKAQYYIRWQDKVREAYLYLMQRHWEQPEKWDNPGNFVMFHPNIIDELMEEVSMERLLKQGPEWNALMPIKTGKFKADGTAVTDGNLWDKLAKIKRDWVAATAEDNTEEFMLWCNVVNKVDVAVNWNVKHKPINSSMIWSREQQVLMETTRQGIITAHPNLTYKGPCTGTPNWKGTQATVAEIFAAQGAFVRVVRKQRNN